MGKSTGQSFKRKADLDEFFGRKQLRGKILELPQQETFSPQVYYIHPNGKFYLGDCVNVMKDLDDESVDLVFADPPYNIKKADWDHFSSQKEYIDWSCVWIEQAARILKPTGSLYICGFSEIVADIKSPAMNFFHKCRWIIWHYKNKASLANDWGRSHESILHFRKTKKHKINVDAVRIPYSEHTLKYPSHPQAATSQYGNGKQHYWEPNPEGAKPKDVLEIPTTCNGMHEKTPHPTQKPEELLRKIILASSKEDDVVFDPFLGSGTTTVCAEQLKRKWIGCDLSQEYLDWAVERVELVEDWPIQKWRQYDFENLKRRNSIR
ncbi:MAG: site-specific DNA-methyltransferase [Candidatus Dadabacteria bacterium]|nr:site-specific DNA-methyltransferase [Candidatus Dadabacteria bacterium]MDE0663729.1 site-specific DNA-methyltransferase [Candidatus Dadabacteria bacterium]